MSIFRRNKDEGPAASPPEPAAGPASGTVPTNRDADLGVPPFRPTPKDAPMTLAPKPTTPPATPTLGGARPPQPVGVPARPAAPADRRTLVVGRGISLQGTVADAERLVVEGTVESQMIQAAELFVAEVGVFKGEVQVEDAEIAGLFDGTITARGSLTIRATGKVNGVARCRKLSVEEGGQVSGRMEMLTEGSSAAPPRPAAPPIPPQS